MPRSKYLVTVVFDTPVQPVYQYYIVDRKQRDILKNLDYEEEGACCSQAGCFACRIGGYQLQFTGSQKINAETAELLSKTFGSPILSVKDMIDLVEEQSEN